MSYVGHLSVSARHESKPRRLLRLLQLVLQPEP